MKEYAATTRLHFNKEEMECTRQLKSTLKSPAAEDYHNTLFYLVETRDWPRTEQAGFVKTDHVKTSSCPSRSRSVTDIRPLRRRRPSLSSLITLRHSTVSGGMKCITEQLKKVSQWCMGSSFVTSSPTDKQMCRSMGTEGRQLPQRMGLPKGSFLLLLLVL